MALAGWLAEHQVLSPVSCRLSTRVSAPHTKALHILKPAEFRRAPQVEEALSSARPGEMLRGAGACPRSTGVLITPGGPCRASTPPLRMHWAPHNPRPPSDHMACGARAGHTPGLPAGPSSLPLPHRQRLPGLKLHGLMRCLRPSR